MSDNTTTTQKKQRKQRKRQPRKEVAKKAPQPTIARVPRVRPIKNLDPRRISPYQDALLSNSVSSITLQIPLDYRNVFTPIVGWISMAVSRGLAATAIDPDIPYQAYDIASRIIFNAVTNQVNQTQTMPRWLAQLCRAISNKAVPFGTGLANYAWFLGEASYTSPFPEFVVGYTAFGNKWTVGKVSTAVTVAEFPTVVPSVGPAPPGSGSSPFDICAQFMESAFPGTDPESLARQYANKIVVYSEEKSMIHNVSAFANLSQFTGTGYGGIGGKTFQAQLEVPIFDPILCSFTAGHVNTFGDQSANRFFNRTQACGGDGNFMGGALSTLYSGKISSSPIPQFHFVDFLEFGDVVGLWVAGIVQKQYDAMIETTTAVNGTLADLEIYRCPLTIQDMQILLRGVMMQAFKDTQPYVQGIYPLTPANDTDPAFVPYIAGVGLGYAGPVAMKLPIPIIENIRALVWRYIDAGKTRWSWIPVLGQYNGKSLNRADYTVSYVHEKVDGDTLTYVGSVFKDPAAVYANKIKRKDGTIEEKFFVEPVISLIDGAATSGPSSVIVGINDVDRVAELCEMWNEWLTTVSQYSVATGVLGTEKGITTLASVCMTRHLYPLPITKSAKENPDTRKRKYLSLTGPYSLTGCLATTSAGSFLTAPWEQVQSIWILPINRVVYDVDNPSNSGSFLRYQSSSREPYAVVVANNNIGVALGSLHGSYASKMVRQSLEPENDWMAFFNTEAEKGRGGILSGLAGALLGSFSPALGSIAQTVGETLGF